MTAGPCLTYTVCTVCSHTPNTIRRCRRNFAGLACCHEYRQGTEVLSLSAPSFPLLFRLYCWTGCSIWGPGFWGRSIRSVWENQSGKKMNVLRSTPSTNSHHTPALHVRGAPYTPHHIHRWSAKNMAWQWRCYSPVMHNQEVTLTGTDRKQLWSDLNVTVLPWYNCLCSSRVNMINAFLIIWENWVCFG